MEIPRSETLTVDPLWAAFQNVRKNLLVRSDWGSIQKAVSRCNPALGRGLFGVEFHFQLPPGDREWDSHLKQ